MNSDRNISRNGFANLLALLIAGALSMVVSGYVRTAAGQVGVLFFGFGIYIAAISYFQMRLEAREAVEKLEYDELIKAKSSATLFETAEGESFPAQRAREQFERVFVPSLSVLMFIFQTVAVIWGWKKLGTLDPMAPERLTLGMVFYGAAFLVLFLLGKYSSGIARMENQRLLRPGSSYLMLGAVLSLVAAGSQIASFFGYGWVDLVVAKIEIAVLGLAATETLILLVFEVYRPRIKGQQARLLYESRLVGLLGQPGGLISTAAQALDYQFGFKVSETWFYRFLERAFAWIVLGQLAVLMLSTTFYFIDANERAVLERFGRPVSEANIEPGLHFKYPWPIDKVYRYRTEAIQEFTVGVIPDPALENERTLLWTRAHYKEEMNMLVASREANLQADTTNNQIVPVNLLTASIPVQYRISNLHDWVYTHDDAAEILERIATRVVVSYLVSVDMDEIMSSGRFAASKILQERIQKEADALHVGAQIIFVGLQDIHPPVTIADAYEAVNSAMQQREGIILSAEGYLATVVPMAKAEANKKVSDAKAYQFHKVADASATAGRFANQVKAYEASPEVYQQRLHLQTLASAVSRTRKYVLGVTNTHDVFIIDLQDKLRPDLEDVKTPDDPKK